MAALEQLAAPRIQLAMEARDEVEGLPGQDFLVGASQDLHFGERTHTRSFAN